MSTLKLRPRVRRAGELRYLTDANALSLLDAEKSVSAPIEWVVVDKRWVRMDVVVLNPADEPLKFVAKVNRQRPGTSSWILLWGSKHTGEHEENLRRLDMRGTHRNPDGEWWRSKTHKHRWSRSDNTDWAYTPLDIPHEIPGSFVTMDDYREVFEAFAAECGAELGHGYVWSDPPMDVLAGPEGLWEA